MITPLELINLYYSDGFFGGNKDSKLWLKMNDLLSWDNIFNKRYQADLCPFLYYIISSLPKLENKNLLRIHSHNNIVSNSILSKLKNEYDFSLIRNIILLEELKKIKNLLSDMKINVIILKGAYLTCNSYYKNIACRPMGDIDILVKTEDLNTIHNILKSIGYIIAPENNCNSMFHISFIKLISGHSIKIEVHHHLAKNHYLTYFPIEDIFTKGFICDELQLLYISWHAIQHGLSRLIWLCDLLEIYRKNISKLNWEYIENKSVTFNVKNYFLFTMYLLKKIFNLHKFPPELNIIYATNVNKKRFYISEKLFLLLQEKILKRENEKIIRFLLYTSLTNSKFMFKYVSKHIFYKYFNNAKSVG